MPFFHLNNPVFCQAYEQHPLFFGVFYGVIGIALLGFAVWASVVEYRERQHAGQRSRR